MSKQSRRFNRRIHQARSRTVEITSDVAGVLITKQELFRKKFGRDPGPSDFVFFDPDADFPQPFDSEKLDVPLIEAMAKSGIDPSLIYAFKKTGLLVTSENWDKLSPEDQAEWNAAINPDSEVGRKGSTDD